MYNLLEKLSLPIHASHTILTIEITSMTSEADSSEEQPGGMSPLLTASRQAHILWGSYAQARCHQLRGLGWQRENKQNQNRRPNAGGIQQHQQVIADARQLH